VFLPNGASYPNTKPAAPGVAAAGDIDFKGSH
jgi:hypothetical protein